MQTLPDMLRSRLDDGEEATLTYLPWAGAEVRLTLAELVRQGAVAATRYRALGLSPGQRVVLMLRSDLEFSIALLGAFAGGFVPVPVYPPTSLKRIDRYLDNLGEMLTTCAPAMIVTIPEVRDIVAMTLARRELSVRSHDLDAVTGSVSTASTAHEPFAVVDREDVALIQFSSGSTGTPKGSMVCHRNFLANLDAIGERAGDAPGDCLCSWLPLYHDMGLLAFLRPLYFNYDFVLMEPGTFLRRPGRWLRAISDHKGTITGCPNFAFDLCTRKISDAELEGVDLSSWRVAVNGAEPIRPRSMSAFLDRFAPHGFAERAFYPCYGMSEFTLAASLPRPGEIILERRFDRATLELEQRAVAAAADDEDAVCLSGLGVALTGHDLRVVDPDTLQPVADGEVGEVLVTGPSLTLGYYGQPELTAAVIGPWIEGDDRAWFRTSDRGFVCDGQLFVIGRLDDLIILRGRNVDPADIERVAQTVDGVRPGCAAAFLARAGDDAAGDGRIVLVTEVRRGTDLDVLTRALKREVNATLGLSLAEVVPVGPGTIPKTSSGKISRRVTRAAYLDDSLDRGMVPDWLRAARLKSKIIGSKVRTRLNAMLGEGD